MSSPAKVLPSFATAKVDKKAMCLQQKRTAYAMPPRKRVFISYSHQDAAVVTPVVRLLRVTGSKVFRDEDCIPAGSYWRLVLSDSLQDAHAFIVFWSKHAADSREVKREWQQAVSLGKDVVPVLLDDTPLAGALREFQYIDFRPLISPSGLSFRDTAESLVSQINERVGGCSRKEPP